MTLQPIDITGLTPVDTPEQTPPLFDWVEITRLRIDPRYQRPLDKRSQIAIQRIAANFDWNAFSAITVAPLEGGQFAVIDGQHRAHAAALCGKTTVPAMITKIDPAQQARTFARVNSAIPISAHQRFRADLEARDPEALAIAAACAAADCEAMTFHPSAATKKPGQVYCIGALRRFIRAGLAAQLTAALAGLRAFDTKGSVPLYSDAMLSPLVGAVVSTGCLDPQIIAQALRQRSPWVVLEQAELWARANTKPAGPARIAALATQISTARAMVPA